MADKKPNTIRRETFVEKIIRRTLETAGGSVDRLFGRGRKPDALPQTADLGERLRKMIDERAQINQSGRKLAPHLIRLKYAWGQTSDEFSAALKQLENELLVIAVDHVNDNRYATLAPIKITSKADILTEGFAMTLGFDEGDLQESEAVEIPVEIYAKLLPQTAEPQNNMQPREISINVFAMLPKIVEKKTVLRARLGEKNNYIVGRLKECDLFLDDASVSKQHASLVFTADNKLKVADVGSTNGTFVAGERIAYGKAYEIQFDATIGFGDVKARFAWEIPRVETPVQTAIEDERETFAVNDKTGNIKIGVSSAQKKIIDDTQTANLNARNASDKQTFVDEALRDEKKTFVDAALQDEDETVVELRDSNEYRTFIDEDLRDGYRVRVANNSGKLQNENLAAPQTAPQKNAVDESAKDSAATVIGETPGAPETVRRDFTQSLLNKKIELDVAPENPNDKR